MIELKKFVCVFILNLLSDTNSDISLQNGFLNKLGLNRTLRSPQRRLFGGQKVEYIEQFPFMVWLTLYVQPKQITTLTSRNAFCGGSIISNRFILTASHCITACTTWACQEDKFCSLCETSKPETVRVMSGGNSPRKFQTISEVKKLYPHPDFKKTDEEHQCLFRSDIGLVELKKPLHFNSVVNKMKLPKPIPLGVVNLQKTKINRLAKQKKFCTILGFGHTMNNDKTSNSKRTLKFTKIQLIDTKECLGHLKIANKDMTIYKNKGLCTDTTVCSYNQERKEGICFGDSGSPLVCGGEQIGVVSWSPGDETHCVGNQAPDIYTRVDVHVPWIQSVMRGKENLTKAKKKKPPRTRGKKVNKKPKEDGKKGKKKKLKKNRKKVNEKKQKAIGKETKKDKSKTNGNKTKYNRYKTKEKKANENKPKTKEKKNITEANINKNRIKAKGKKEETQDNRKEGKGKETQDRLKEGKEEEKRERRKKGKGEETQENRKEEESEETQEKRKERKGEETQDRRKARKREEKRERRKEGKGEEIQENRKEEQIQDIRQEGKGEEIQGRRKEGKGEEIQDRWKEVKGEEIQDRRKDGKKEETQGRRKEGKGEEIQDIRKEGKKEEFQDRRKEGKGEEIEERQKPKEPKTVGKKVKEKKSKKKRKMRT